MSEGTDWVEQARRLVAGLGLPDPGQAGAPADGHVAGGDCRWCPVCQVAAVVRRPEVSEALADALTTAATALRAMAAAAEEEREAAGSPGTPADGDAPAPRPAAPVQHIEIA